MMDLKIQIFSFLFSFFFGIFLFYIFRLCHKLLFIKKKLLKFIFHFFICLILSFLYFFIIYCINSGVVQIYFVLLILFGFLITYSFTNK